MGTYQIWTPWRMIILTGCFIEMCITGTQQFNESNPERLRNLRPSVITGPSLRKSQFHAQTRAVQPPFKHQFIVRICYICSYVLPSTGKPLVCCVIFCSITHSRLQTEGSLHVFYVILLPPDPCHQ